MAYGAQFCEDCGKRSKAIICYGCRKSKAANILRVERERVQVALIEAAGAEPPAPPPPVVPRREVTIGRTRYEIVWDGGDPSSPLGQER